MLARLARRSGCSGRRCARPVPSSTAPSAVGISVSVASQPPRAVVVGENAMPIASRYLHRTYSQFHNSGGRRGGVIGAQSSALRGDVLKQRAEGEGRRSGAARTTGRITPQWIEVHPPPVMQSHRFYSSAPALFDGRWSLSSSPRNSLVHAKPMSSLAGGFGDERFHRDNPLFMRTMDSIVRRAMSSSAPQPQEEAETEGKAPQPQQPAKGKTVYQQKTVYDREKMKSAAARVASVVPPPHSPPHVGSSSSAAKGSESSTDNKATSSSAAAKRRSSHEQLTNPPTLVGAATEFVQSIPGKARDLTSAAAKAAAKFLAATPGVLWFYLTHPREFRQKLLDLKEAAKKEAHHYWMGSKLLAADVRTARGLLNQTLRGSPLTRRERKQLLRTVSDVFRLVPMSIFVLVPFMEFALPFALKIFPNMLPSTFQDSLKAEENMKRELRSRIAMAEFFQETLQDLAKEQKKRATRKIEKASEKASDESGGGSTSDDEGSNGGRDTSIYDRQQETAASFLDFIEKARKGEMIPPDVIIKFSTYFQDELTLDNMPRMQLVNMSRYMGLPPYGSDNFLRLQLRFKIRSLLEDDQRILWEGIDSLTKMELREACQERGMRSTGLSKDAYKRALQQWLDLSVNKNVPISLLIMSRTFFLKDEMTSGAVADDADGSKSLAGLADAISGLDKEVLNEVVLEVASAEEKVSNPDVVKIKLDVLEHQNELIAEEKKQRDEAAAKKKKQQEEEKKAAEAEKAAEQVEAGEVGEAIEGKEAEKVEAVAGEVAAGAEAKIEPVKATEPAPVAEVPVEEPKTEPAEGEVEEMAEEEKKGTLSTEEMEAISHIASPDPVVSEREDLERLKAAMKEQEEEEEEVEVVGEEGAAAAEVVVEPPEEVIDVVAAAAETMEATVEPAAEAPKETAPAAEEPEPPVVEPIIISDDDDKAAAETIAAMDAAARDEAEAVTKVSFEGEVPTEAAAPEAKVAAAVEEVVSAAEEGVSAAEEEKAEEEEESHDERLDKAVDRLKSRVESMVGKIEVQLSDVEAKIGDKLHLLDKDMDDMISMEEMAQALQTFLKRELTYEEAMAIAEDMDSNKDGFFTIEELVKWVETNQLVQLVEEGRDGEVDRMIAKQAAKMKERYEEEAQAEVEAEGGMLEGEPLSQDKDGSSPPSSGGKH